METTEGGGTVLEEPVKGQDDSIPLDHVKQVLGEIHSAEDLLGNISLFEYCAALDDITYQLSKNLVKQLSGAYKCQTAALQTMDVYRKQKERERKEAQVKKQAVRGESLFFPDGEDKTSDEGALPPVAVCSPWEITRDGVSRMTDIGSIQVCHQIVFPNRLFQNIESSTLKVELLIGEAVDGEPVRYHSVIVDKLIISKASTITDLANLGLDISSETAKPMVAYLQDIEAANRKARLKRTYTTSKFGWGPAGTEYEKTFVPYDPVLEFDGAENFRKLLQSLQAQGKEDKWLEIAKEVRQGDALPPRVALATSFASILVGQLHINPFIVDFWGVTEKGKTVMLMLAASVWADPVVGRFVSTFRSTSTGFEVLGDVLNSLPMILDDSSNASQYLDFEGLVYSLCEGSGKTRSNKTLGQQKQTTWKNAILTNGERPLHRMVKQGGAINRVLEVDCNSVQLFGNPRRVYRAVRANYGHAGRRFVAAVQQMDPDTLTEMFEEKLAVLPEDAMEKQRQAAACILLADTLATQWIFKDGRGLEPSDISGFLTVPDEVSEGQRAYQYLADVVSMYQDNFREDNPSSRVSLWGKIDDERHRVYFFRTALDEQLRKGGFDMDVLVNWCKAHDLLIHSPGKNSTTSQMNIFENGEKVTKIVRCICIKLERTILPTSYEV